MPMTRAGQQAYRALAWRRRSFAGRTKSCLHKATDVAPARRAEESCRVVATECFIESPSVRRRTTGTLEWRVRFDPKTMAQQVSPHGLLGHKIRCFKIAGYAYSPQVVPDYFESTDS
jgi:hypothetical protein